MHLIFTIGHSTRAPEDLLACLTAHGIRLLADVRTVPKSRRHPAFSIEQLPALLEPAGIRYAHVPALGGLRRPRPDSINTAWRHPAFRGYADHMQTQAFADSLAELLSLAAQGPVAVMCAEAVPWRCHRSLLSDALLARGAGVRHIMTPGPARPHRLTPWALVTGGRLSYPGEASGRELAAETNEPPGIDSPGVRAV